MAFQIPRPRSFNQTLGDIVDTFRSRAGISNLKVGGVALTAFESAAQSDVRSTQDIFNLLDLRDLDRTEKEALDLVGADEELPRRGKVAARGYIDVFDSSFTKVSSRVYSGAAAPVAGSTIIRVSDASLFPSTGQIYIGRGTVGVEGPISFSARTQVGQYWEISLVTPTINFHNFNEEVVLAKGGNRTITNSTTVTTPVNALATPLLFQTTQVATILDGETAVRNVPIICTTPGTVGNVPSSTIRAFLSVPFPGATCLNSKPLSNGTDIESDPDYRAGIRNKRASKSRGTDLAILTGVRDAFSPSENKRVKSASLVSRTGQPSNLYIDDGQGYEEQTSAVAYEVLTDNASGGELDFAISGQRPIAKAFVKSSLTAPFTLTSGCILAVEVGGVLYQHTFSTTDFTAIASATAQEVVSSINSNSEIQFSARTANGGTRVSIFARTETNEDVKVTVPEDGDDANAFLGFSTTIQYTLKLYKNDELLYEDGRVAVLNSAPQTQWSTIATGVEFRIAIDGTSAVTYIINDADFVLAGTPYTTVSQTNSMASWVAVLNKKVAGVTFADGGGFLIATSNLGSNSRAALEISGTGNPNFVTAGVFTTTTGLEATGLNSDYTLDRNRAQVTLSTALAAGDTLTVGSPNTRATAETINVASGTVSLAATARLWMAVDSGAERLFPGIVASSIWDVTPVAANETQVRYTVTGANFDDTLAIGDYVIVWDPAFNTHGAFVINDVDANNFYVSRPFAVAQASIQMAANGVQFFRLKSGTIQEIRIASGANIPLATIATSISAQILQATASVFRNQYLRVTSNSFEADADISILTADAQGQLLGFSLGTLETSSVAHRAFLQSQSEVGPCVDGVLYGLITGLSVDSGTGSELVLDAPGFDSTNIGRGPLMYFTHGRIGTSATYSKSNHIGNNVDKHYNQYYNNAGGTTGFSLRKLATPQNLVSLARVGTVVTGTVASAHDLVIGDIIVVGPLVGGDVNFPSGAKVVISTPTTLTFTYTEAGAAASAAVAMAWNPWDGAQSLAAYKSSVALTSPMGISARDGLTLVLDNDFNNKLFSIPMYRTIKPTTTLYDRTLIQVVDTDNGGVPLSTAFGTSDANFFADFFAYMRSRTISHKNTVNKSIIWRSLRYGPEGDVWQIAYVNPTAPDQDLSHTTSISATPTFLVNISLPSGAARTGLNLAAATRFTAAVTPAIIYDQVVFSYSAPAIAIGGLSRTGSVVTATTATNHGFTSGTIVYLTSVDANFTAGAKTITVTGATTFTYVEAGLAVVSTVATSVSSVANAPDFTSVAVGDVVNITNDANNGLRPFGAWRVYAKTTTTFTVRVPFGSGVAITTPVSIGSANNLTFYPIDSAASTAALIAAYAASDMDELLTATLLGTGATAIDTSTADEYYQAIANRTFAPTSVPQWSFSSGMNHIQTSDLGTLPNTILLKDTFVDQELRASSDFTNEYIKLVPNTAATAAKWLNSSAVSGVGALLECTYTDRDGKLQLASKSLGQAGGILVAGGAANTAVSNILGVTETAGQALISVAGGTDSPFTGASWVALENALPTPKPTILTAANTIALAANGQIAFNANVAAITQVSTGAYPTNIHKVGKFVVYDLRDTTGTFSTSIVGNWVDINLVGINAANRGQFRVVEVTTTTLWVENENGVSESGTYTGTIDVYDQASIVPGDNITIGWLLGDNVNVGTFNVTGRVSATTIQTDGTFVPVAATVMGVNFGNFSVQDQSFRLLTRISGIAPNPLNDNQTIVFSRFPAYAADWMGRLSPNLGATMSAIDKFAFPAVPAQGANGYAINTGLLAEVTRILYGDLNAPKMYPGIVANGAHVNSGGPNLKRIRISIQIRTRAGATQSNVINKIRAAIVTQIAQIPLGQDVDISLLLAVARKVEGVSSVVPLSPEYGVGHEVISLQANEKAAIFDIVNDIAITIAD